MDGHGKLDGDGYLKSRGTSKEGFVSLNLFTKDENGDYYKYYQLEMVDDMYISNDEKILKVSNKKHNESIYNQIDKLELKCIRPSRELNKVGTATDIRTIAKEKLAELDVEIEILRSSLK